MINPTEDGVRTSDTKFFFIRVGESEYRKIAQIAESEDRSINKMANILLKRALEQENA